MQKNLSMRQIVTGRISFIINSIYSICKLKKNVFRRCYLKYLYMYVIFKNIDCIENIYFVTSKKI